jgi:hypothetical protein
MNTEKESLYVVRNENWGQIVGVYNWQGLKDYLRQLERNELPVVERNGYYETFLIDAIARVNHTRSSDEEVRQVLFYYGKMDEDDASEENVLWHNARVGLEDEHGGFEVKPQPLPVTDLLLAILQRQPPVV